MRILELFSGASFFILAICFVSLEAFSQPYQHSYKSFAIHQLSSGESVTLGRYTKAWMPAYSHVEIMPADPPQTLEIVLENTSVQRQWQLRGQWTEGGKRLFLAMGFPQLRGEHLFTLPAEKILLMAEARPHAISTSLHAGDRVFVSFEGAAWGQISSKSRMTFRSTTPFKVLR